MREALESEDVEFLSEPAPEGFLFSVRSSGLRIDVTFETLSKPLGWTPDLITGSAEGHGILREARGIYRISFDPSTPQPSVGVFEALWCIRSMMEHVPGVVLDVTAFKLHGVQDVAEITELDFDIRDHINLHAVQAIQGETPLWIHSHGMEKFGIRDVEAFHLAEKDLLAGESFFHQLCTDLAFGQGPVSRLVVETAVGTPFMLLPSEEARNGLMGVPLSVFDGHEGPFSTVVSTEGRHTLNELLKPYREKFEKEPEEKAQFFQDQANTLLPSFKTRFGRKGWMEPLGFLVRSTFECHPGEETVRENLWVEILHWDGEQIVGRLVDGSAYTTEWRKGAQVDIVEKEINALAMAQEGHTLEQGEMEAMLEQEKPV